MRVRNREFKPGLIPSLATLIVLPILIALGFWQLDRAEQKRVILAAVETKMNSASLTKIPAKQDINEFRYQQITLQGQFDNSHLIYVDNKIVFGKVGYFVVAPFLVTVSNKWVLVNLGWVAMGKTRQQLPSVSLPDTLVSISGRIKTNVDNVFSLSEQSFENEQWPLVVQWVSPTQLSTLLETSFQPLMVLLDKPGQKPKATHYASQFKRQWKFISASPDLHTSYAMQWFTLAFVLVLIFFGVNTKKVNL